MKINRFIKISLLISLVFLLTNNLFAQLAINENSANPDPSAMLDISSNIYYNKGVLIPRLTTAQRNSLSNPAAGLLIYNSDTKLFNYWDGSNWSEISGSDVSVSQNSGTGNITGIGIMYDNSLPHHSALLEVKGYTGGILIPRMSTSQRNSISNPANGLIIYNTDSNRFNFYNGTSWQEICGSPVGNTTGSTMAGFGVAISEDGLDPHSSAILEIKSSNKGLLIPRLTNNQRNNIPSPAEGLWIYNTDTKTFQVYKGSGVWLNITTAALSQPTAYAPISTWPTGFKTSWSAVPGASGYYLDVAFDNGFTNYVPGYQNLNVGNVTNYDVTGLNCGSLYYYRVRAYNACAQSNYSNVIFTGTTYCGSCGSQQFVAAANNGGMINASNEQNNDALIEKYCYNNISANCATYGGYYQWAEALQLPYSANNSSSTGSWATCDPCGSSGRQGVCPNGHHVPTDLEFSRYEWCVENSIPPTGPTSLYVFQTYNSYRGSNSGEGPGYKMKASYSTWDGNNSSGFNALPAGYRYDLSGSFFGQNANIRYWTATQDNGDYTKAFYRELESNNYRSLRDVLRKQYGFIVRCLVN